MIRKFTFLLVIILLVSVIPMVNAQEPEPGTAADNSCNVDGSMEGKCISDWHWRCGWFLARYESGSYTLTQVPADCAAVLIIPYMPPAQFEAVVQQLRNSGYFTIMCDCEGELELWQWYAENAVMFDSCPETPPDVVTVDPTIEQVLTLLFNPNWAFCIPDGFESPPFE